MAISQKFPKMTFADFFAYIAIFRTHMMSSAPKQQV